MRLCLTCAQVGRHEAGCPDDPAPRSNSARIASGVAQVKATLAEADQWGDKTWREALRLAWVAQQQLERHPVTDFETFDAKRARNDLANAISKVHERAAEGLGETEANNLIADMTFARRALELFADVARRRHEAVAFDLSEFVQLPPSDRREVGEALKELCGEVEKSLTESTRLEEVVSAWGPENVAALAADLDPVVIPPEKIPPIEGKKRLVWGVAYSFGGLALAGLWASPLSDVLSPLDATLHVPVWIVGSAVGGLITLVGLASVRRGIGQLRASEKARREAPALAVTAFHELSVNYRQRVYMSAALRILREKATSVEKAEEAFRQFTTGNSAARWKRLCSPDGKDVVRTFFDWDGRQPRKDAVSLAVAQALGPKGRLRPFDEMATDGWEVLLKAFLLDLFAGDEARFFDGLAHLIAEGALEDKELEARAVQTIEAWNAMVGGESPPS